MRTITKAVKVKRIIEGENNGQAQTLTFDVRMLLPDQGEEVQYFGSADIAHNFLIKASENALTTKARNKVAPANKKDEPISRVEYEQLTRDADVEIFASVPGVSVSETAVKALSTVANAKAELQKRLDSGVPMTNEEMLALLNA